MLNKILFLFLFPFFVFCASQPVPNDIKVAIREYDGLPHAVVAFGR